MPKSYLVDTMFKLVDVLSVMKKDAEVPSKWRVDSYECKISKIS